MLPNLDNLRLFAPELVLVAGILLLFVLDLVVGRWKSGKEILTGLVIITLGAVVLATFVVTPGVGETIFAGMVRIDLFSAAFKIFFAVVALGGILLAYQSRDVARDNIGAFYGLLLSLVLGMVLLSEARNLLMLFLALELVSLASYVLAGFGGITSRRLAEGAMKYVIYGGVASGVMLYGISILYGLSGGLDYSLVQSFFAASPRGATFYMAAFALVLTFAGFGYKIAAVPFHMWCPDVYEGAPTPFTAFLSIGPKAAGFAALARFLFIGFAGPDPGTLSLLTAFPWPLILGILAAATMTVGNLTAILQNNLKRLLAYSSIAHAGYLLMGLSAVNGDGLQSVMFYLWVYLAMNMGAFLVVIAIAESTGSEDIATYRGLGRTSPLIAVLMAIFLFSLTGLPPFAGFIAKFYLFAAILKAGGAGYYALAVIGGVNSAVALYYYARVVKTMFLEAPDDAAAKPIRVSRYHALVLVAFAIPTMVWGVRFDGLSDFVKSALANMVG